jgi:hypothetical protein
MDVREKDGVWTGRIQGRQRRGGDHRQDQGQQFAGDWDLSPHAVGTFELKWIKKKPMRRRSGNGCGE